MLKNLELNGEHGERGEHGELPVVEPGEGSLAIAHHLRLQAAWVGRCYIKSLVFIACHII